MDKLIDESLRDFAVLPTITLWELTMALGLAAGLSYVLARVYCLTHAGHNYSRAYVQTLVFVAVTISLIMVIIGSNIARAFALVGAMSIVRFRNPVKDSRDVAFIFMAMAIGMATGTKFHLFAVVFTAFVSLIAVAMHHFRFAEISERVYVLRLRMRPADRDAVEAALADAGRGFDVVSIDKLAGETEFNDFIYELTLGPDVAYETLVTRIGAVSDEIAVSLLVGEGSVNV